MAWDFLESITDVFDIAGKAATVAAAVAPVALPFFLDEDEPDTPAAGQYETVADIEAAEAEAIADKRRRLNKRQGQASTFRAGALGGTPDFGVRSADILSF